MTDEQSKSNQPDTLVTEEEWSAWKEIPTTKIFRELLQKRLRERQEDWTAGLFPTPEKNAKAIGEVQVLKAILALTAQEINEGMSDE